MINGRWSQVRYASQAALCHAKQNKNRSIHTPIFPQQFTNPHHQFSVHNTHTIQTKLVLFVKTIKTETTVNGHTPPQPLSLRQGRTHNLNLKIHIRINRIFSKTKHCVSELQREKGSRRGQTNRTPHEQINNKDRTTISLFQRKTSLSF